MKGITSAYLSAIYTKLEKIELIKSISDLNIFYDEPKPYHYSLILNFPNDISDGRVRDNMIAATGVSFKSAEHALFKCFLEAIERCSTCIFDKKNIQFLKPNEVLMGKNVPSEYIQILKNINFKTGWVEMDELVTQNKLLVPAQLIYFNFSETLHAEIIFEPIGTGAAAGFKSKDIILNGMLEIIERDAFITTYLLKAPVRKINTDLIHSEKIQNVFNQIKNYALEIHIFDITNDLQIPVIMCILLDKTGIGPAVSVGLKCSFNMTNNILESIGEALTTRIWMRKKIMEKPELMLKKNNKVIGLLDRGIYWYPTESITKLNYLFKLAPTKLKKYHIDTDEYSTVLTTLGKKGYTVLTRDITPSLFQELCSVKKVLIPELQPLYLDETKRQVKTKRIREVANFFKIKYTSLNALPHPFL